MGVWVAVGITVSVNVGMAVILGNNVLATVVMLVIGSDEGVKVGSSSTSGEFEQLATTIKSNDKNTFRIRFQTVNYLV